MAASEEVVVERRSDGQIRSYFQFQSNVIARCCFVSVCIGYISCGYVTCSSGWSKKESAECFSCYVYFKCRCVNISAHCFAGIYNNLGDCRTPVITFGDRGVCCGRNNVIFFIGSDRLQCVCIQFVQ